MGSLFKMSVCLYPCIPICGAGNGTWALDMLGQCFTPQLIPSCVSIYDAVRNILGDGQEDPSFFLLRVKVKSSMLADSKEDFLSMLPGMLTLECLIFLSLFHACSASMQLTFWIRHFFVVGELTCALQSQWHPWSLCT